METNENKGYEVFKVTGNWQDQSKKMKTKNSQLADSDPEPEKAKESHLLSRLETRFSKTRDEMYKFIME